MSNLVRPSFIIVNNLGEIKLKQDQVKLGNMLKLQDMSVEINIRVSKSSTISPVLL